MPLINEKNKPTLGKKLHLFMRHNLIKKKKAIDNIEDLLLCEDSEAKRNNIGCQE